MCNTLSIKDINTKNDSRFAHQYNPTIRSLCAFNLTSFFGRVFLRRKPPKNPNAPQLLNVGAGNLLRRDWVNADFYSFHPFVLLKYKRIGINWLVDARHPLACYDNHWDGIFCEHMLEHLNPQDAVHLIVELFRTLKPGKWIRLSVPDLETYVNFYRGKKVDAQFRTNWKTGAEAIYSLTRCFGHQSVWDFTLLSFILNDCGFTCINKVRFGYGADRAIILDNPERRWESVYLEARKPE